VCVLVRYFKAFRPGLASCGGAACPGNAHLTSVAQNFRKVTPDFDRRIRDTDCDRVDSDQQVTESGRWPGWGENRRNPTRTSTAVVASSKESSNIASATPLWPPTAWIVPESAVVGSVVGFPSASSAHSGGIVSPRAAAAAIKPRAATAGARSTTSGSPCVVGNPRASDGFPKVAV
jgi:hypothetical protein